MPLELMIEKWSQRDGSADYLWSLWQDGKRVEMGGRFKSAEAAETAARLFCRQRLNAEPDRITRI